MSKNNSRACVVVHEEIDTMTVRVDFKIMKGEDGRAAVVQPAASGASLSGDTVFYINDVSTFNIAFTAATCKTKVVPLLVSTFLYLYFFLSFFEDLDEMHLFFFNFIC